MPNKTLFISAGEISGDIHSANLMKELCRLDPTLKFVGLGGKNMMENGLESFAGDVSYFSSVGVADSLPFRSLKRNLLKQSIDYLKNHPVDALILVDNQGFNIPL